MIENKQKKELKMKNKPMFKLVKSDDYFMYSDYYKMRDNDRVTIQITSDDAIGIWYSVNVLTGNESKCVGTYKSLKMAGRKAIKEAIYVADTEAECQNIIIGEG